MILRLMPKDASVVDLGSGNGELLSILGARGYGPLLGVERDQGQVVECVERGLSVIHLDLDHGLSSIPDQSFQVALLSQTLQSIVDVAGVLDEVVQIGRRGNRQPFPISLMRPCVRRFKEKDDFQRKRDSMPMIGMTHPTADFPRSLIFRNYVRSLEFAS